MSTRRFSKIFGKGPKSTQGQHLEIVHDGIHEIEGEILLPLLDVPEMELLTAHPGRDSGLRFAPSDSQLRNRQSKDFSRRFGFPRVVRTDRFGHTVIVAIILALK
jgi:hypothetical protein